MTKTAFHLDRPQPLSRSALSVIFVIFLCALIVRMGPLLRPLDVIDGRIVPDDTYLSLEVAKNVGLGRGPVYGDHFTNGYQPLYVILAAQLFTDFEGQENNVEELDKRVIQAIAMVACFDLVSLLLLGLLLSVHFGWTMPTYVGMLIWAIHPYVTRIALNGLETSMASMFILLIAFYWGSYARAKSSIPIRFLLGMLLGLGVMTRIDIYFLGFWILVLEINDVRLHRWRLADAIPALLVTFVGFVLAYAPWVAWSYSYTNMLLPESGPAVRFQSMARLNHELPFYFLPGSLAAAIWQPAGYAPLLYLTSLLLLIWGWFRQRRGINSWFGEIAATVYRWPVLWALTISLVFVYGLYIFGWWFLTRYLFITVLTPVFILAAVTHYFMPVLQGVKRYLPVFLVVAGCFIQPRFWQPLIGDVPITGEGYRAVGLWARDYFPDGTVVGAMQTGGIGYYAPKLEVLNLDGVVDKPAFEAIKTRNLDVYMKEKEMQYYLGWPVNTKYLVEYSYNGKYLFGEEPVPFLKEMMQLEYVTWGQKWTVFEYTPL